MLSVGKTIRSLGDRRRQWERIMRAASTARAPADQQPVKSPLREVSGYGSNPGALRMFAYVPPRLTAPRSLVVILHGCTQTAAGYDFGAGWSTLAERHGFALVFPQQQPGNNPKTCFNWFLPGDTTRGSGEALSIRQMIEKMIVDHNIDRRRVFVTGLSAGGAMTSVMLATYPEVFAAGAIIAGLPYGVANNVQSALQSMFQAPTHAPSTLGDLVRSASRHHGPWPRVSVWHGGADATVKPVNADEIVKQWVDVHGLNAEPTFEDTVNGYPRRVWRDAAGEDVIESYTITGMAHGTPLAAGTAENQAGTPGAFMLEAGISSSHRIARFWGLADQTTETAKVDAPRDPVNAEKIRAQQNGKTPEQPPPERSTGRSFDVQAVIARALKAAGLMKSQS